VSNFVDHHVAQNTFHTDTSQTTVRDPQKKRYDLTDNYHARFNTCSHSFKTRIPPHWTTRKE